jgi:hypothetical protein
MLKRSSAQVRETCGQSDQPILESRNCLSIVLVHKSQAACKQLTHAERKKKEK